MSCRNGLRRPPNEPSCPRWGWLAVVLLGCLVQSGCGGIAGDLDPDVDDDIIADDPQQVAGMFLRGPELSDRERRAGGASLRQDRPDVAAVGLQDLSNLERTIGRAAAEHLKQQRPDVGDLARLDISDREDQVGREPDNPDATDPDNKGPDTEDPDNEDPDNDDPKPAAPIQTVWIKQTQEELMITEGASGDIVVCIGDMPKPLNAANSSGTTTRIQSPVSEISDKLKRGIDKIGQGRLPNF